MQKYATALRNALGSAPTHIVNIVTGMKGLEKESAEELATVLDNEGEALEKVHEAAKALQARFRALSNTYKNELQETFENITATNMEHLKVVKGEISVLQEQLFELGGSSLKADTLKALNVYKAEHRRLIELENAERVMDDVVTTTKEKATKYRQQVLLLPLLKKTR